MFPVEHVLHLQRGAGIATLPFSSFASTAFPGAPMLPLALLLQNGVKVNLLISWDFIFI